MKPEHAALTSNAAQPFAPRRCCSRHAVDGKMRSGVVVPSTIRSISRALTPAASSACGRRVESEIAGRLANGRKMALADAGARRDPLVAGIDQLLEIGVGDDFLRQIAAGAGDA